MLGVSVAPAGAKWCGGIATGVHWLVLVKFGGMGHSRDGCATSNLTSTHGFRLLACGELAALVAKALGLVGAIFGFWSAQFLSAGHWRVVCTGTAWLPARL